MTSTRQASAPGRETGRGLARAQRRAQVVARLASYPYRLAGESQAQFDQRTSVENLRRAQ